MIRRVNFEVMSDVCVAVSLSIAVVNRVHLCSLLVIHVSSLKMAEICQLDQNIMDMCIWKH